MAAPITHIVLALNALPRYFSNHFTEKFIIGTSFPDIRYMGNLSREQTHSPVSSIKSCFSESSFESGVHFHVLIDQIREQYMFDNGVHQIVPFIAQVTYALKLYEDRYLYDRVNNWDEIDRYFDSFLEEEKSYGVNDKLLQLWHTSLQEYISSKPTFEKQKHYCKAVGISEEMIAGVKIYNDEIESNDKITRVIAELYSDFNNVIHYYNRDLAAFQISVNGKQQDYRLGKDINLDEVKSFFSPNYVVKNLKQEGKHVYGIVEKDSREYFLKLCTTEGISVFTQIEARWNEEYNKLTQRDGARFIVPRNFETGRYNNLFYLITEKAQGNLLIPTPHKTEITDEFISLIDDIIDLSELIQDLELPFLSDREPQDHQEFLVFKCHQWYDSIPEEVRIKYKVSELLTFVEQHANILEKGSRHGDFTPWHIFKEPDGKLFLIDGEHALSNGVEYYDIAYFIQRMFSIVEQPEVAKIIYEKLINRNYDKTKLAALLASRGIGGYLDESLKPQPNYDLCSQFQEWVFKSLIVLQSV